jgi:hypothetical protein
MKKVFQIIILNCFAFSCYAKSQTGIYMTASDYKQRHLSYEMDSSKIRLNHSVWDMPYITVKVHGKKRRLNKSEVYAYVDHGREVYRFYKNEEYLIAEVGNMNIYLQAERISLSKGYEVKMRYYFSTTPEGEIIPLTTENLINAYRNNGRYIDLLDQFLNNGNVTSYDKAHGTFKVNYIYAKALK